MNQLIIIIASVFIAYVISYFVESLHYMDIKRREQQFVKLPMVSSEKVFDGYHIIQSDLVYSEVALATDHFKRFMLSILSLFGLNIVCYEKLLDRARREAILRLKEKCLAYDAIINLKMETVEICNTNLGNQNSIKGLQVLASATAVKFEN